MPLKIDLYSEISCPWCFIGHHRLDKVLKEKFPEVSVEIDHHPVLLLPNAPPEGLYIPDLLRLRYGVTDPKQAFARPESEARASGFPLDLSKQLRAYPTRPAHALLLAAKEKGTQHPFAVAVTDANFLDAKNISDPEVLADIALRYGFTRDEAVSITRSPEWHRKVDEAATQAALRGVRSVPHFIFGDSVSISGGQSEGEIEAAITSARQDNP